MTCATDRRDKYLLIHYMICLFIAAREVAYVREGIAENTDCITKQCAYVFCRLRRIGTLRSTNLEERYEKRLEQEKPVLDALLSWANEMQAKTAPKSALGRAIGSAPFLDFASKAYRKKAWKAIHQTQRRSMAKQKRYHQSGYAAHSQQAMG